MALVNKVQVGGAGQGGMLWQRGEGSGRPQLRRVRRKESGCVWVPVGCCPAE